MILLQDSVELDFGRENGKCPPSWCLQDDVLTPLLHGPLQREVGSSLTRTLRSSFELPVKNLHFDLLTDSFCFSLNIPTETISAIFFVWKIVA